MDNFVSDCEIELNGYKADFEKLEYGIFFFTHHKKECFSTMAIEAGNFFSLYDGPIHTERKTGTEECPSYCKDINQLNRCDAFCECAFVREVINIIREKRDEQTGSTRT